MLVNIDKKSYIYLDETIDCYSNLSLGLLIRAIGEGQKIAYIDSTSNAQKLTNLIENLSLSHIFVKSLPRFQIDFYTIKKDNKKIAKTIIPQVEYGNIPEDMFWNSLDNYDLIIFDDINLEILPKIKLISTLTHRKPKTQIIATTKNSQDFKTLKNHFNIHYKCTSKKNTSLTAKKGIINIFGEGEGKSLYAFGYLLRNFINKNNVKLIYFDKGDDIYGDAHFFFALKKWTIKNNLYGTFDFVKTGIKRYWSGNFRQNNTSLDEREANDALMLLKTSLKKQTPVIADELNNVLENNLLKIEDVLNVLLDIKNEIVITGDKSPKQLIDISFKTIDFTKE
jgi:ATP:corrinoid adenosyltransferase